MIIIIIIIKDPDQSWDAKYWIWIIFLCSIIVLIHGFSTFTSSPALGHNKYIKTVCEYSYQETNHFCTQPTQNTLTRTQEKASGEAEVPEYTDRESDCNCIQVHPILQVSCLSRDVRSSPLGGAHNLISNQGQTLSPSPLLVRFSFSLLLSFRIRSSHFGACWSTGMRLGKRLLQEIGRPIIEDAYQSTQFHTVSMPFEVCFVCVWGFFTTRVHKTERSKRSNTTKERVIDMGSS